MAILDPLSRSLLLSRWDEAIGDARLLIHEGPDTHIVGCRDEGRDIETVEMTVRRARFYTRTMTSATLGLGEAYMDEDYDVEGGLDRLFNILLRNRLNYKKRTDPLFLLKYLLILATNKLGNQSGRIKAHYDLGIDLYESFLDPKMVYTSGYYLTPDDGIEAAETTKLDRICRKLDLSEGQELVDLGCGFGGLLIHAARNYGIRGIGITLSPTQAEWARKRVAENGLGDRIDIRVGDYGSLGGSVDKVVSTGMLEHLYEGEYQTFFNTVARYLRPGGLAVIEGLCNSGAINRHDPFIQKYIFPGSNQPLLSQIARGCERAGLVVLDVENYIRSYHLTVLAWHRAFEANRHRLDPKRYDKRFVRMWQVYFALALAGTRYSKAANFETLVTNDHMGAHRLGRV
jgi:cyclopropane-fatty-acyl-phospholipid synthase